MRKVWLKQAEMDAITMDGDAVSRSGSLEGGFVDSTKSKLAAYEQVERSKKEVGKLDEEEKSLRGKVVAVEQTIAAIQSEVQKMEAKKANLQHVLEQTAKEVVSKKSRTEE